MKFNNLLVLILIILVFSCGDKPGETGTATDKSIAKVSLTGSIPDLSSKGIPSYPGAIFVSKMSKGQIPLNTVLMATKDPVDKVKNFYISNLKGWKNKSPFDGLHIFWRGKKTYTIGADSMKIESISITKISSKMNMPKGTKTNITIGYK